jgi:hypothetical protein
MYLPQILTAPQLETSGTRSNRIPFAPFDTQPVNLTRSHRLFTPLAHLLFR